MDLVLQKKEELLGQGNLLMKKLLNLYLLIILMARIGCQPINNHIMCLMHETQYYVEFDTKVDVII